MAYAFGFGLERLAMILYNIPDIRLFWSDDARFLDQFKVDYPSLTFKPFSKHPANARDVSFWIPSNCADGSIKPFHENEFFEIIREEGGDWVESVVLVDEFVHPVTKLKSRCYRISYRSMSRYGNRSF